jgi:GT2 family glycosyltransferase
VKTTILLLSVDEAPMLERSLPAALAQHVGGEAEAGEGTGSEAGAEVEVVVIDNACADATAELAERLGARLIRLPRRRSYAGAINDAIEQTEGDAVLLLNADCFLRPGFLAAALPRLAEPGVGSVAPKLLRVEGPSGYDELGEIDAAAMVVDRRRKNGLVGHGHPARAFDRTAGVFGADGAAALYRRATLVDCALAAREVLVDGSLAAGEVLDEDMELWASDADLAWRAQLYGWRSVYEPAAVAEHVRSYSPSTRSQMSEQARRLQFRNRYLMMIKNDTGAGFARDLAWIASYEILALGHVLLRERHLLGGYRDAWRLRGRARLRRRLIQERRRGSPPFGLRAPE